MSKVTDLIQDPLDLEEGVQETIRAVLTVTVQSLEQQKQSSPRWPSWEVPVVTADYGIALVAGTQAAHAYNTFRSKDGSFPYYASIRYREKSLGGVDVILVVARKDLPQFQDGRKRPLQLPRRV